MGRGRKPISNFNGSEWETVFYNSVGTYVQYINNELLKEYKAEPLSNHLKIVGGYAFKTSEYKNQGVPIIRISDFNNEQVVLKDVVYYQESKELDKYQLVEGDIIIALTGGTIAKLGIVQAGLGKIYLNQRVGKFLALKPDEFEVEYIYWLARSIQSIIKNLAWGAAIPNVSPKQIEELKFPFPSKVTQRGIIDFLNNLKNNNLKNNKVYFDESIESKIISLHEKQLTINSNTTELTHQLALVKKLRQQLLQDAVQGKLVKQDKNDEPASELLKKIKSALRQAQGTKKIKELPPIKPEEIPFDIPENWVWCRLGEICTKIGSGSTPKGSNYSSIGIPFFRSQNIQDNELDYDDIKFISDVVHKKMNGTTVFANDLLLNITGGSMGRCTLVSTNFKEGNVSQHVCIIRPLSVENKFYHSIILSPFFQNLIFSSTTGAGREGLPKCKFNR
jgi:type I restriction enzyme S subunit